MIELQGKKRYGTYLTDRWRKIDYTGNEKKDRLFDRKRDIAGTWLETNGKKKTKTEVCRDECSEGQKDPFYTMLWHNWRDTRLAVCLMDRQSVRFLRDGQKPHQLLSAFSLPPGLVSGRDSASTATPPFPLPSLYSNHPATAHGSMLGNSRLVIGQCLL